VPALGQETSHTLPTGLQTRVLVRCREQGLEPFALFLQAFGLALQRTLRIDMPIVSTPFSRRMRQDMFSQVDYCIDLRFIEAGLRPQESLREANRRIRESIWQAQQRQIQPVTALAEALNHLRPGASAALSQFHLTWRLDPTRNLRSDHGLARVHRVPQVTARHGLALHAAQIDGELVFSIEAVQEAQVRGWVGRVWEGFTQALDELLAIDLAVDRGATPDASVAGCLPAHEEQVAALWAQWLGPRSDRRDDARTANWFREGGSSLSAMRMIASINKHLGTDVGLHQFLQNPTRAHLLGLLSQGHGATGTLENVHWVGPSHASHLKVLLPGYAGSAVGVFKLAQAIVTESTDCAVLCVDLDAIVRATDSAKVFQRCQDTILGVLKAHRADRQVELVGYSLGGLLALHALMSLPDRERSGVPVWLLDTYSPGRLQETLWYRAERFVARRWHRCTHVDSATAPTREAVEQYLDATEADEHAHAQWDMLAHACNRPLQGLEQIDVTLVRTLKTAREVGLIWRNRSNGWSPDAFRRFEVRHLDTDHLGITQRDAQVVAKILSTHGIGRTDTQSS
jgi:surfactin synthase thioesterase subunit